jgi:hypothetical protein
MSALLLDDVPEELYRRLEQLAAGAGVRGDGSPTSASVGLGQMFPRADVPHILERMRNTAVWPAPGTPDGVDLLREDRNR